MTEWIEDMFAPSTTLKAPEATMIQGRPEDQVGKKRRKGYKGPAKPVTDEDLRLSVAGKTILG